MQEDTCYYADLSRETLTKAFDALRKSEEYLQKAGNYEALKRVRKIKSAVYNRINELIYVGRSEDEEDA